jgi:hypothetical protein
MYACMHLEQMLHHRTSKGLLSSEEVPEATAHTLLNERHGLGVRHGIDAA